jgi:hypothetical protein
MRQADKDKLIQAALKRYEDAQTRYDELMPVAHTLTPGVEATPEPDGPALRAQRREAKAARDEAWRDLKELIQGLCRGEMTS